MLTLLWVCRHTVWQCSVVTTFSPLSTTSLGVIPPLLPLSLPPSPPPALLSFPSWLPIVFVAGCVLQLSTSKESSCCWRWCRLQWVNPSNQLSILAEYIYLMLYHVPHRTSHTRRPSWWTAVPKWPARRCGSRVLNIIRSSGIHINTSCSQTTMALMCLLYIYDCRSVKTEITRRPSTVSLFRRGSTFRYRSGESGYIIVTVWYAHVTGGHGWDKCVFLCLQWEDSVQAVAGRNQHAQTEEQEIWKVPFPPILIVAFAWFDPPPPPPPPTGSPVVTNSHAKLYEQTQHCCMCKVFYIVESVKRTPFSNIFYIHNNCLQYYYYRESMISQLQIYPAYTQIYIGHFYKKDIDAIHCKVMHEAWFTTIIIIT